MKNIYLTKAQELNLKYAGLDLGDETGAKYRFFSRSQQIMERTKRKKLST